MRTLILNFITAMKQLYLRHVVLLIFLLSCLRAVAADSIPVPNPDLAPFYHGVASGDPTPDRVIIWTRITPDNLPSAPLEVHWEIATDTTFSQVLQSGTYIADSNKDFTVKIDVGNLSPYTTYYYRFSDAYGRSSLIGRTKTAPSGPVPELRFIVASCSSVFSGYFNAYRRIAENRDLDLVIHVGDYIYDFVDSDEPIRVPTPYPTEPRTLSEWRARYAYYRLDSDLRAAHQQHPFIVLPDNHDFSWNSNYTMDSVSDAEEAFYEWLPMREPADRKVLYRKITYGDLADIFFLDARHYREIPSSSNTYSKKSMVGQSQLQWFKEQIKASTARWHLIGTQEMFGQWDLIGFPFGNNPGVSLSGLIGSEDGNWDGFNDERVDILQYLRSNQINNNIFMTGDIHMGFAMDLVENPFDPNQYNTVNGGRSIAVEFLPYSITRINLDEKLHHLFPLSFYSDLVTTSKSINRHHLFENLIDHGYGILDVRPDTSTVEFWASDKYHVTSVQQLQGAYRVLNGENHYRRQNINTPSAAIVPSAPLAPFEHSNIATLVHDNMVEKVFRVFPNPATDVLHISRLKTINASRILLLDAATGSVLKTLEAPELQDGNISIPLNNLSAAAVFVVWESTSGTYTQKIAIIHP